MQIHRIGDVTVLNDYAPVPGFGGAPPFLPVNAFVLHAQQPVVIDTGLSTTEKDFRGRAGTGTRSSRRPLDLDHPPRPRSHGRFVEASPSRATSAPHHHLLGLGIMSTEWTLPLNRLYLLNPGQTLDVGDRRLQCFRPPLFDSPSTTGFLDERTGALFSSDCFGAPMPSLELATSADVRAVGDQVRDLQLLWATIDSPWVQNITRHASAPPLIRSGPWEPRRSSAATCRRYRSQTIDCSTPCCSHGKQAHSSGPTK